MGIGKLLHRLDRTIEGLGLVVVEEHQHRRQRAVGVVQAFGTADGVVQHVLVAGQGFPLQVALVHPFDHLLGDGDHGDGRLHARGVLHLPHQLVHRRHGLMGRAAFGAGLDHDHQYVGAGGVVVDDEVVVLVVARVRTQFRGTLVEVADLQVLAVPEAAAEGDQGDDHGDGRHHRMGEVGQQAPERMVAHRVLLAALDGLLADAHVGDGHRQQDQVGEDDHRHADGRADGQFADHADVDDQQGDEPHGVGEDGDHARQEQLAEGAPRRGQGVVGTTGLQGDAVDLLHAVGDADGEDQEGHQHRIGIETEAHAVHQAQLPDHRHQGGGKHGDGAADAPGEPVEQHQGDEEGDTEEQHHHDQAVDQVTDLLREAHHMDLHVGVLGLVLVADLLFQLMGELAVVELQQLALVLRVRIGLQQWHVDDAGLEVVRHQAADLAGLEHVVAQLFQAGRGTVVGLRDDLAAGEAFLGHLGPANARAPQGLQAGTVDTGDVEDLVMDLPQGLHVLLAEDVAVDRFHRDTHGVAQVGQVVAVLDHLLDVGMMQRDHLLEAGGGPHLQGLPEEEDADQQADDDHRRPVVEDQAFEEGRLVLVMGTHRNSPPFL
ncbi:hypothetical protein D3C80_742290 [compost metagenome]